MRGGDSLFRDLWNGAKYACEQIGQAVVDLCTRAKDAFANLIPDFMKRGLSSVFRVEDLSKQVGLPKASPIGHLTELNQALARSFVVSGNPMYEVARLLSNQSIQASVQNQALQFRRRGEAIQKEAVVLSAASGLIESPEVGSEGEMTVRSLLMPELLPGLRVKIESAIFNGFAVIKSIRFTGANFGTEWEAEYVCMA